MVLSSAGDSPTIASYRFLRTFVSSGIVILVALSYPLSMSSIPCSSVRQSLYSSFAPIMFPSRARSIAFLHRAKALFILSSMCERIISSSGITYVGASSSKAKFPQPLPYY